MTAEAKKVVRLVKYHARAIEDEDGRVVDVAVNRVVTLMPITRAGAMQHLKRVTERDWEIRIPVGEVGDFTAEIVNLLTYYASAESTKDRA